MAGNSLPARVDWVDYGKGICILLVVMWHSTLGVEAAARRGVPFQHGDLSAGGPEVQRAGEAAHAGPDHNHMICPV